RDEGWARLLEVERAEDALCGPLRFGNAGAEALYAPIREGYASGAAPTTLDPTTERLRAAALLTRPTEGAVDAASQALVAFWVGTAGLGFVFDVFITPRPWSFTKFHLRLERTLVGPPDGTSSSSHRWLPPSNQSIVELRRLLFALPEADFARAHAEGLDWLRRHDGLARPDERSQVAYALARDPSLAHDMVREALAAPHFAHYYSLLGSITDLALTREFVARYVRALASESRYALDVVEAFGRDAAEMMSAILEERATWKPALWPSDRKRLEAAWKLALTDPRPPTPAAPTG
ncbi:MAG: hypothetical protein JWM10_227, partial [Myxococcaceae bacterium]|nr:hypothetical protein [Myxococcaceae bacterium]